MGGQIFRWGGAAQFQSDLCTAPISPRGVCGSVRNQKIGNVYVFRGGKKMKRNALAGAVVSALGLLAGSEAHAAAFALYEQGVSGLGNAYAGAAAVAEDATTIWWNPAGMSRLGSGKHFVLGGSFISPSTKFSDNGSVRGTGSNAAFTGSGGDAGKDALVPSIFFAMDLSPQWSFGVGVS